ncbi:MAG: TonB-dependent receptor [Pseudomonadota bacterium]
MLRLVLPALLSALLVAGPAFGEENLTELSIEELLTVEVTSVAKKRQRVEDAPAAVFVISSEDIRRSGATRITDLFRMVPGMQVGENETNSVAVSARGFNERFANKLLILVDGRAIYRSVLSGVFWDQVLVPLQEVERIEVVRGPGATLWGANAVNGVINIITKHPIDTQGGFVSAGVGTNELGRIYGRWGGLLGNDGAYRFYVRGDVREGLVDADGAQINENARAVQTGFRLDWEPTEQDAFTFQGDFQRGDFETIAAGGGQTNNFAFPASNDQEDFLGFNFLGRWTRTGTEIGDFSVQGYVDFLERGELGSDIQSIVSGFEFQHSLPTIGAHEVIWGANVQLTSDQVDGDVVGIGDGTQINTLFGMFIQDEISLIDNELSLTLGTKLEHNSFSGFEIQPSARLFWRPDERLAFWGAVSRAVRTPALFEEELRIALDPILPGTPFNPGPLPINGFILGSDLEAEELYAFEVGTRFDVTEDLSIDVAGYANLYDNLIVLDLEPPVFAGTSIDQSVVYRNNGSAVSFGAELSADWDVTEWWRLKGAYAFQTINLRQRAPSIPATGRIEGLTPIHQGSLRAQFDINNDVEFDLWFRGQSGTSDNDISGFVDMDARLSWRPLPALELSITGRNLLQAQRPDFSQSSYPAPIGQIERSVFGLIEYRF